MNGTRMKSIPLTPENSKGVTRLAALIGWRPDELANHLLAETLEKVRRSELRRTRRVPRRDLTLIARVHNRHWTG